MSENIVKTRFKWVVDGLATGPDSLCDIDLEFSSKYAVVPSLGSLEPGWLLAIPKKQTNNIAELKITDQEHLLTLSKEIATNISSVKDEPLYFEHGATYNGSLIGCGVDQAHLHIAPLGLSFMQYCLDDCNLDWIEIDPKNPWQHIEAKREYYLISDFNRAFISYPVKKQSQYIRQLYASFIGKSCEWNYKEYPNYENIAQTVSLFKGEFILNEAA